LENPRAVSDQSSTSQSQVEDTIQTNHERPRRIITTPTRLNDYVETYKPHANVACTYACIAEEHEPVHYHEACESVDASHWRSAMEEEMESLRKNNTWDLVELPRDRKAIGCRWVYKLKKDLDGNIERYKARLVAKGYAQKYGIDFNEIFSRWFVLLQFE
jgi:hypothetical protein